MKLVTRKEWGAAPARGRPLVDEARLLGLAVHYSGMGSDEQADHRKCPGRVRGMQRYHMEERGWLDLAYNWIACRHGVVFQGRGYGVRSAANGTSEANDRYLAVCVLGDDSIGRDDLTDAGRFALQRLVVEFRRRYPHAREVRPHSDFVPTECPGDELRALIPELAALWPVPLPRWFWEWARWRLGGRRGPRPVSAPPRVPAWAWRRLRALIRPGKTSTGEGR